MLIKYGLIQCIFIAILVKVKTFENGIVTEECISSSYMYVVLFDRSFIECIKECQRRPRCRSVNYLRNYLLCYLNYVSGRNGKVTLWNKSHACVHSDKTEWPMMLSNGCEDFVNQCHYYQMCSINTENHKPFCEASDCGEVPRPYRTILERYFDSSFGQTVRYTCERDFILLGNPTMFCNKRGRWVYDQEFRCVTDFHRISFRSNERFNIGHIAQSWKMLFFEIKGSGQINFRLSDADVNLTSKDYDLGFNSSSCQLYQFNDGTKDFERVSLTAGQFVETSRFLPYWMSWDNNTVLVGKGLEFNENVFLKYLTDYPLESVTSIKAVGEAMESMIYKEQDILLNHA